MKCIRYGTEENLVEDFKRCFLLALPKSRSFISLQDMETTWGIVDVLIVAVRHAAIKRRRRKLARKTIPALSNLAALSLVWLQKHPHSDISALRDFLRTSNGTLKNTAELLEQRGLIQVFQNGAIRLRSLRDTFVIGEILAFEAKLTKWKKVVEQAERHLWFTNSSYVVMPELKDDIQKRVLLACKKRGLGFISMEKRSSFIIHLEPLHNDNVDTYFRWKLNEHLVDRSR